MNNIDYLIIGLSIGVFGGYFLFDIIHQIIGLMLSIRNKKKFEKLIKESEEEE